MHLSPPQRDLPWEMSPLAPAFQGFRVLFPAVAAPASRRQATHRRRAPLVSLSVSPLWVGVLHRPWLELPPLNRGWQQDLGGQQDLGSKQDLGSQQDPVSPTPVTASRGRLPRRAPPSRSLEKVLPSPHLLRIQLSCPATLRST